jgi:hypothetical protein
MDLALADRCADLQSSIRYKAFVTFSQRPEEYFRWHIHMFACY